ncbi:hypothetical protein Agub_g14967 [Astrephomene gubernaculifera]|uniref:Uncharacterized protein n=1 Tax=Astrephomene gubernaculifera TaxID=47775 RepID=A0AAD3HTN3_9CHLO|nr:hypothetical protein Agub_g14967 [Astrephomene gubernaculifera]
MAAITMQRIRPFAGVTTTFPCRTRIVTRAQLIPKRKCTSNDKIDKARAASFGEKLSMAIPLSLGALAVAAPRAMSEDLATMPTSSPAATDDALLLALSTPSGSIEELIVPLLFGVVALLLTVVTGGVAYINIKQWLDNRQEKEDRDRDEKGLKNPFESGRSSAAKAGSGEAEAEDGEVVVPLKRASRLRKEKGKGFADIASRR